MVFGWDCGYSKARDDLFRDVQYRYPVQKHHIETGHIQTYTKHKVYNLNFPPKWAASIYIKKQHEGAGELVPW